MFILTTKSPKADKATLLELNHIANQFDDFLKNWQEKLLIKCQNHKKLLKGI